MPQRQLKTIHYLDSVGGGFGALQALYLDRAANWLRPNLSFVGRDPRLGFDINELGLKGDDVDPSRKLAVVWGDSVVFGVGRGWPHLLDELVPGYQFLNGGIEGNSFAQILDRAVKLNAEQPVALNLVFLGWHPIGHNEEVASALTGALSKLSRPVLLTIPSALNRRNVTEDLSASFVNTSDWLTDGFYYQESAPYSVAWQARVFQHLVERNAIISEVGDALGVPVIDLFAAMDTEALADFREDFFDVYHPRWSAFPKMAAAVAAGLRSLGL